MYRVSDKFKLNQSTLEHKLLAETNGIPLYVRCILIRKQQKEKQIFVQNLKLDSIKEI